MKMFVQSVTLLFLHQACSLVPVMQVQLGEPATFLCALPKFKFTQRDICWYKQSPGDTLKLIAKLTVKHQKLAISKVGTQFSDLRWKVSYDKKKTILTILRTTQEDLGTYHCAIKTSTGDAEWSATNLILKGITATVQWPTVSDPVNQEDSVTTQCSVLSGAVNKMCPGDISMFLFTAKSDKYYPEVSCTDGNRREEYTKRSDSLMNCFHHFISNVISYDATTFYCAVPLCGEILFENGTKLEDETASTLEFTLLMMAVTSLIISVIVNIAFLCYRVPRTVGKQFTKTENTSLTARHNVIQQIADRVEDENNANYAALDFSERKERERGRKVMEMNIEESVYSQIKLNMKTSP